MTKLWIAAALACAAFVLTALPAAAGGWAVTSLDSVPTAVVGQEVAVGFTILRVGAHPVDQLARGGRRCSGAPDLSDAPAWAGERR